MMVPCFRGRGILFAAALATLLSGCSVLGNMTTLRAVEDTPGWKQSSREEARYDHPSFRKYLHSHGDTTFTLCTSPETWRIGGLGPPVLPLIPLALFMDPFRNWPEGLFMYLQVDSAKDKVAINLAEIRLRIPGRPEVLTPAFISRYERGKEPASAWKDVCGRPPGHHESVHALQHVAGEQAQFVVRFDVLDRDVNACELEIGAVRVGDEDVMIPPLRYERSTSWFYAPFIIPHGGPMLGFVVFGGKVIFPHAGLRPSASPDRITETEQRGLVPVTR